MFFVNQYTFSTDAGGFGGARQTAARLSLLAVLLWGMTGGFFEQPTEIEGIPVANQSADFGNGKAGGG